MTRPRTPKPRPAREVPFDLTKVRTRPIASRKTLVSVEQFGTAVAPASSAKQLLASFPDVLGARDLRALAGHVARAHEAGRGVAMAMGGHVVKTGCVPVVLDLARRGIVTSFHLAGSTAIHDFEIALAGRTSEDVAGGLGEGVYGMSDETGAAFAEASARAKADGIGLGRALGLAILDAKMPHAKQSLLAEAALLGIPCTVHVAVGTDTVHMHPDCDGAAMGEATHQDFRIACTVVSKLDHGVWINVGSAVLLPEVFLKTITVARNTGHPVADLTTANFDMIAHYRTTTNVVRRPGKRGFNLIGQHEILLPIFRMAVIAELGA